MSLPSTSQRRDYQTLRSLLTHVNSVFRMSTDPAVLFATLDGASRALAEGTASAGAEVVVPAASPVPVAVMKERLAEINVLFGLCMAAERTIDSPEAFTVDEAYEFIRLMRDLSWAVRLSSSSAAAAQQ